MKLKEKNIAIDFDDSLRVKKFDDRSHGLSHCMKAVDFIVEDDKKVFFIEFKDPDHPGAKEEDREKFLEKFKSAKIDEELKYKYRDSFLYEYAAGNLSEKPIIYLIMINAKALSPAALLAKNDTLKKTLPVGKPIDSWIKPIVHSCLVISFQTWNRQFANMQLSMVV